MPRGETRGVTQPPAGLWARAGRRLLGHALLHTQQLTGLAWHKNSLGNWETAPQGGSHRHVKTGPTHPTRAHSVGTQVHARRQRPGTHSTESQGAAVGTVQHAGRGSTHVATGHVHIQGHEPPPKDVASTLGSRGPCTQALLLPPVPPMRAGCWLVRGWRCDPRAPRGMPACSQITHSLPLPRERSVSWHGPEVLCPHCLWQSGSRKVQPDEERRWCRLASPAGCHGTGLSVTKALISPARKTDHPYLG